MDDHIRSLQRVADTLGRATAGRKPPATMFAFTDPARTPDPLAFAALLPRGAALIYRSFGAPDAVRTGGELRRVTRKRGVLLLIGEDERLAAQVAADGVHLPERSAHRARAIRARRPYWAMTVGAHSPAAVRKAVAAGADAVILSAVFQSRSASAGKPLGVLRLAGVARSTRAPVIALGGVNARTIRRLVGTGAAGFAAVDGWLAA